MKKRYWIIFVLVLFSTGLTQLHMLMNNMESNNVDLFKFVEKKQDVQWYVKDTFDYISTFFIYLVIYKLMPKRLRILGMLLLVGCVLDLLNYWLFYHQYDWAYKSLIIIIGFLSIILAKNEK
jgi:hypothetical protein